ncbi:phage tail protein [Pseudomonas sp. 1121_17]|uniref:phage tail protein n=1 Tax=Pseudomonas sp. 1121_17 TaxID=2604458 RepID=UPI00406314C0
MVDQNSQFYAILTNVGAAKQANADALGIAWKITQLGVGDANGNDPTPNATQVSLINEWRRAPLNQLKVDDKNSAVIVAEQVIPAEVGGHWIREIALYDADGDMVAVANCAPTYKPLLSQGSGRTQVVRMNLVVSSASNVQLKIDPSVVLATREWVTEELARQDFKHSVVAATTANIVLGGLQTVDGVALLPGNRVLVKNQTAAKDNGLYSVAAGAWTRSADTDTSAKVTPGLLVHVEKGTANGDSIWQLVTDALISLGVSGLSFEMVFGRTGVAAGTYRSVTVDKNGHVTAAANPTTVAGYGLTDVYTKAEVTAALALKAALDSPLFTGNPRVPTVAPESNDYSSVNTYWARRMVAQFNAQYGLGHTTSGAIPATKEELNSLPSGNYYYPSVISPYPLLVFVQRMAYATNRGFEIANYPYQKRILGRVSNNDGTWQEPFELANLESPGFTGIPTGPTAAKGSNTLQIANTAFVQTAIAAVVDSAPGTLDTLKKLAASLANDPNFATTTTSALASKANKGTTLGGYGIVDALPLFTSVPTDIASVVKSSVIYQNPSNGHQNALGVAAGCVLTISVENGSGFQLYGRDESLLFRGHTGNEYKPVRKVFHSGNFDPDAKADKATTLAGYGIADALVVKNNYASRQQPQLASPTAGIGSLDVGLVMREAQEVGAAQVTDEYAPGIGFYWAARKAGRLIMDAAGVLKWSGNPLLTGTIATQTEVNQGATEIAVVTPKRMRFGFAASMTSNGYLILPTWLGGFVFQWGTVPSSAVAGTQKNFVIPFPTKCLSMVGSPWGNLSSAFEAAEFWGATESTFFSANSAAQTNSYFAIGY